MHATALVCRSEDNYSPFLPPLCGFSRLDSGAGLWDDCLYPLSRLVGPCSSDPASPPTGQKGLDSGGKVCAPILHLVGSSENAVSRDMNPARL